MENISNDVVQSLWISESLSINEVLSIRSYLMNGHSYHLYTYADIRNIPEGIIIKDANDVIPEKLIFRDSANSYAAFADWFRFKLLYERGGWWVDTDTICLRHFDIPDNHCFSSEYNRSGKTRINATYMKARPKAEYLGECLKLIDGFDKRNIEFGGFGLTIFQKVMMKYEYMNFMKPPEVFCPINWFELGQLIALNDFQPAPSTLAIHLWNEMWRRGGLNKNATYHPGSIYERLKRKYLLNRV